MTEPCAHRWSEPQPVWVWSKAGELVKHPTEKRIFCLDCDHSKTVEREPK